MTKMWTKSDRSRRDSIPSHNYSEMNSEHALCEDTHADSVNGGGIATAVPVSLSEVSGLLLHEFE